MIPWREFEVVGESDNKIYVHVIKNITHTYTGEVMRYSRIDYSDGREDYERLLKMRSDYQEEKPVRIPQKDWEEFWD